jgi:urease accessory protein UreF
MDRLAAMETFVCVVETGSFSAAARRLNIGQPAVSKTIAQLESRLGPCSLLAALDPRPDADRSRSGLFRPGQTRTGRGRRGRQRRARQPPAA